MAASPDCGFHGRARAPNGGATRAVYLRRIVAVATGLSAVLIAAGVAAQPEPGASSQAGRAEGQPATAASDTTTAAAQRPAAPPQPSSDVTSAPVSEEEMADIEAALRADQAAEPPVPSDAGASAAPGGASPSESAARPAAGGAQSMNPDLSLILDVAGAWFSDEHHLQTGGHDPTRTGFNLQQLELSVASVIDPYFRFDGNLVFSLFGVELEEAYGTTLDLPLRLQMRFGQFLSRFGRLNATHPHTWDFVDQPFALGRVFGSEGNRGLGVELSWLTPLPWYVELLGSVTHAAGASTARSFYGDDDLGVDDAGDLLYVTALKQFHPLDDDWSLFWGVSGAFGPNSTGRGNRTDLFGADVYLKYRPITRQSYTIVSVQSEVIVRRRQVPDDLYQDVGLYAQVFWRFAQRWGAAARYEYGSPVFDIDGTRVGESEYRLDPEWMGERHRLSSNVTFWPTEFSRLRLQESIDMPQWRDDPIEAVFLTAELVAGAHGAHTF